MPLLARCFAPGSRPHLKRSLGCLRLDATGQRRSLSQPEWAEPLTPPITFGLTPLFWSCVRRYGEVSLDMDARLNLAALLKNRPCQPVPLPGAACGDPESARAAWAATSPVCCRRCRTARGRRGRWRPFADGLFYGGC